MMKLKMLTAMVMAMFISGCNDSDDKQNTTPQPTEKISEYYSFEFSMPAIDESEYDEYLMLESLHYQVVNGVLYKALNPHVEAEYTLEDSLYPSSYITAKGIFSSDESIDERLGAKHLILLKNEKEQWTTRPATVPESDIQDIETLKWHDLSAKKMTERTNVALVKWLADDELKTYLDPTTATLPGRKFFNQYASNFVQLQHERSFPQGAACFQFVSSEPTVDYIIFDTENPYRFKSLEEWADYIKPEVTMPFIDGQLYNIPYKKAKYDAKYPFAGQYAIAVDYQNQILDASFVDEKTNHAQVTETFINNVIELVREEGSMTENHLKVFRYYREGQGALLGCDGYNSIAAEAIHQALKDAKPKS